MVVHGSIFHYLMLAIVMADEILKSFFHIVGQRPLTEYILVHSHVLMFEVGWQECVKMTYHIPPLATVNDLFSVCMGTKLRAYKLWKDVEKCVVLALCE